MSDESDLDELDVAGPGNDALGPEDALTLDLDGRQWDETPPLRADVVPPAAIAENHYRQDARSS